MQTKFRKSLSVLLSVLMALSVFGGLTFTAGAANTYQISSYAELKAFADAVNGGETDACAILTADVTAEGADWTPIGDLAHPYTGAFDGDGHTITGLSTESNAGLDYVGLFGYVGTGGVVQNVGLVGGSIKGASHVGAVAGCSKGQILNCYNTGEVRATHGTAGGVVGQNNEGVVQSCYNTGTVRDSKAVSFAGGVVGENLEGTVQNCYNTGDVSGAVVGGVVGKNFARLGGSAEISSCFNTGNLSGIGTVGGVAGSNYAYETVGAVSKATVTNCYNMGAVFASDDYAESGGVVGWIYADPNCTVFAVNCYNAGAVTAGGLDVRVGGVIGLNTDATVQNCYYDSDVCAANNGLGTALTTAQMTAGTYTGGVATDMPGFSSETWLVRPADDFYSYYPHLKGFDLDATGAQLAAETIRKSDWPARKVKDGATEIANYDKLKAFAAAVNGGSTGLKGILTADVTAEGTDWTPIGNSSNKYTGAFEGDGHTITGLSIDDNANRTYSGLFGYVDAGGVVQNVGLVGGSIIGKNFVGAVAGENHGKIINCYNTGEVTATGVNAYVGGVVGNNYSGTVQSCYNTGTVGGETVYAGGVVGYNTSFYDYITTLFPTAAVADCYNTGDVSGTFVGGVVGFNGANSGCDAKISNCFNTGKLSGTTSQMYQAAYVGGVAGFNSAHNMMGRANTATVTNCYNMGAIFINGDSADVGGIVGDNASYDDGCTAAVTNCYSAGTVTAEGANVKVGGVTGRNNNATLRNCYYDCDICSLNSAVGNKADTDDVKGLPTAQMTGTNALTQMTFSEPSAWLVKDSTALYDFYPHLKGFDLDADGDQMEASAIDPADWPAKRNHSHTYGAPVWSWEKCRGKATAAFTCSGCGDEQTVTDNAPVFENGQFTATAEFEGASYTDTVSLSTGDLVEFGSYPQSEVTDETLKTTLNSQTLNWTSYKYYFDGAQDDFMQYADVTYNGNRYRAVEFIDHYRPKHTTSASTDVDHSYQLDNGYDKDIVYWFRYEPIVWRILDADAGLMMTESIVDSQPFSNGYYESGDDYYGDANFEHYASDWAGSSLRAWLNGSFLNAAFDSGNQSHIKNTSLVTPSSYNPAYDAGPTTDKIFLLSEEDALNTAYGFSSDLFGSASTNRTAFGTDYAKCQGLYVNGSIGEYDSGASHWYLRTPFDSDYTSYVWYDGYVGSYSTNDTSRGIRPALRIDLQSAISQSAVRIHHDCGDLVPEVPATCTDDGAIAHYVCSWCGANLDADRNPVADLTIPAAHTYGDTGDDRFTCTVCGQVDDALKAAAELADAEEQLAADTAAAQEAEALIAGIGEVTYTDACRQKIEAAQNAVDALTPAQLALVDEEALETLFRAEETYARLKQKADHKSEFSPCELCGEIHDGFGWDMIVCTVHRIIYMVKTIAGWIAAAI